MHAFVPPLALPRRPVIAGALDSRARRSVSATARPPSSRVPPSEFAESADTGAQAARANASSPSNAFAPEIPGGKNAGEQADVVQDPVVADAQAVPGEGASADVVEEVVEVSKGTVKEELDKEADAVKEYAKAKTEKNELKEVVKKANAVSNKKFSPTVEKKGKKKSGVKDEVKQEATPVKVSPEQIEEAEKKKETLDREIEKQTKVSGVKDEVKQEATPVKITAEKIEEAAKKKEKLDRDTEKQTKVAREGREKIFLQAQSTLSFLGDKTGVINLGKRARSALETRIDAALAAEPPTKSDQDPKAPDAAKKRLTRTAATAFRSLSGALAAQWDHKAVPLLRERVLPPEAKEVDSKALASSIVALVAAVVLLPALFSGGSQKQQMVARKELDSETATLQRKLERAEKTATPSLERSPAAQKLLEKRARTEEKIFPNVEPVPDTLKSTTPAPAAKEAAPAPVQVAPSPTPKPAPTPENLTPAQSTPALVRSSVERSFGAKSGLISSASFDSLAATPTVVIELTPSFARLSEAEQRSLAQSALQSARQFGFESVTLLEAGSGAEFARAGINIVLTDENASIRAQLAATRTRVQNLAAAEADAESERDAARARLLDERAEFAVQSAAMRDALNDAKEERNALLLELQDAQAEIAAVPDREALEVRTREAEVKMADMEMAVETLSRQIVVARDAQMEAERVASEADVTAREMVAVKEKTIREADVRVADVRREVMVERDAEVARVTEEMKRKVADAEAKVEEARTSLRLAKEDAEKMIAKMNEQMEKEIRAVQATAEKDAIAARREREEEVTRLTAQLNKKVSAAESARAEAENALRVTKEDAEKMLAKANVQSEREIGTLKATAEKELAAARRESEEMVAQSEKTFSQKLDQLKKDAQTNLQTAMKEADARLAAVREETKAAVQGVEKRERDSVREANNARESAVKELRKVTRERESLAKQLERIKAKTGRRDAGLVPEGSDVAASVDVAGEGGK